MLQKDQSNMTMIPGDLVVKVCPRSDSVITYRQLNSIHNYKVVCNILKKSDIEIDNIKQSNTKVVFNK